MNQRINAAFGLREFARIALCGILVISGCGGGDQQSSSSSASSSSSNNYTSQTCHYNFKVSSGIYGGNACTSNGTVCIAAALNFASQIGVQISSSNVNISFSNDKCYF